MPAAATCRALEKPAPLTEQEAVRILTSARFLVAQSNAHIKPGTVLYQKYEVWDGKRSFQFPAQPLYIVRELTRSQYLAAIPPALRGYPITGNVRFYELHTD